MTFSLEVTFYLVVIVSMICYTVLDGFDLGVGCLHLLTKKDEERRVFLNAIGPVWDGNAVWLVVIGGALFAGFPEAFATLFSAFYNLVMLLLFGLIFRAVAIEFRSKHPSKKWRHAWDIAFSISSFLIAFGIGMVLGNLIQGIPLNANKDFVGQFSDFFTPYTIVLGLTSVSLFTMHGAIYLVLKTEGHLQKRLRRWVNVCIPIFILFYLLATVATIYYMPHMVVRMVEQPWLFCIPVLAFLAIFNIPRHIYHKREGWAFIFSSLSIAFLLSLFAIGTFPILIRSNLDPLHNSLSISNAASSPLTLKVLLIIVAIGVPLVLGYGFYIYRIFRGKVKIDPDTSY